MSKQISTANVRKWFREFLVAKEGAGLAAVTLSWYRQNINIYLAWVDEHEGLCPFDATSLENFLAYRARTRAMTTTQAHYRSLSTFCRWLIKRRYITALESPLPLVEKPRLAKRRMKYVTQEEFDQFYASIRGNSWLAHRDRLLLTILFYSGLRANELLRLRPQDIELGQRMIFVRNGKGNKDRIVPFAPQLPALLAAYLGSRPLCDTDGVLFVSDNGSGGVRGPMEYDGFKQMFRRRCRQAGLAQLRPHAFRHGFAMWALNNGMPLSAVSAAMGHSSTTVTESVYAHWTADGLNTQYNAAFARATST